MSKRDGFPGGGWAVVFVILLFGLGFVLMAFEQR